MGLRKLIYKTMCRIGIHNTRLLPTANSTEHLLQFEVCCARCGKPSNNQKLLILVRILNKVEFFIL